MYGLLITVLVYGQVRTYIQKSFGPHHWVQMEKITRKDMPTLTATIHSFGY